MRTSCEVVGMRPGMVPEAPAAPRAAGCAGAYASIGCAGAVARARRARGRHGGRGRPMRRRELRAGRRADGRGLRRGAPLRERGSLFGCLGARRDAARRRARRRGCPARTRVALYALSAALRRNRHRRDGRRHPRRDASRSSTCARARPSPPRRRRRPRTRAESFVSVAGDRDRPRRHAGVDRLAQRRRAFTPVYEVHTLSAAGRAPARELAGDRAALARAARHAAELAPGRGVAHRRRSRPELGPPGPRPRATRRSRAARGR